MLDVFKKRRSYRKYKDKKIEDEKIDEILRACMTAPSAMHTRAWEFVVIRDKNMIQKLGDLKQYSLFARNSNAVIVVCSKDWKRWMEDACIVAEHIYLEATNQGLGTCWIQVSGSKDIQGGDAEEYLRKALGIPEDIRVLCFFSIGYPDQELPEHKGEIETEKVHKEIW